MFWNKCCNKRKALNDFPWPPLPLLSYISRSRGLEGCVTGRSRKWPVPTKSAGWMHQQQQHPGRSEYLQQWPSAQPPSFLALRESAGAIALRKVLSTIPSKLLPPYPCIRHHLLPSPSAVKLWRAPSPNPTNRSPWQSKGPACHCLW